MSDDGSTLRPNVLTGGGTGSNSGSAGLVRVFDGSAAMATVLPLEGGAIELGRGSAALADAPDLCMSRRHARVEFDGSHFWVTDHDSQNGTFVDGRPAPAHTPCEAQRIIRMGESLFVPRPDVRALDEHGVTIRSGFVRGPAMQRVVADAVRAAELGFSLCLRGESGTGKEGVARAFHENGPRAAGPFVPVNCAAIQQGIAERLLFGVKRGAYSGAQTDDKGYLQAADGGTLFLDEVAELDLQVQAKLLRAIELHEVMAVGATRPTSVDLRLCSASNRDLRAEVTGGRLREDLYFRIGRPELTLPPLRDRPEELPTLLEREVRRHAPDLTLHVSLVETCLLRPWPGNVRELLVEARTAAQAALLAGKCRVSADHLDANAGAPFGSTRSGRPADALPSESTAVRHVDREVRARAMTLEVEERARIEEALRQQAGNVAATARALGMHRTHLRRLIARHGITGRERD